MMPELHEPRPYRLRLVGTRAIESFPLTPRMYAGAACVICGADPAEAEVFGTIVGQSRRRVFACAAHSDDRLF
ncbi:hypothetical protein ACTI_37750 [Actinoplanes sp. OR16]|uniref:hypothetical protein n=1 Tax=Actinoplanes sp. OR16 TaxID=946334 RepID=UPI000F705E15|nr:hypothetical protein [Actinoplanes sp. OR16]BBH67090.1 hypothetical protein ACTI_37750 [Actinoplanes sp. OR16]